MGFIYFCRSKDENSAVYKLNFAWEITLNTSDNLDSVTSLKSDLFANVSLPLPHNGSDG